MIKNLDLQFIPPSLTAARPPLGSALVSHRYISSSLCSRDASREAESSTSSARVRPAKGDAYLDETKEEAFRRNLREVQAWRRQKEKMHVKIPFIPPSSTPKPKPTTTQATLSTLLSTGAALGHSSKLVNKSFASYVYGNRSGLSIIDLDQTLPILRRTAALVRDVVKADGVVLIIGTRAGHKKGMDKAKERLGDNGYCTTKWLPGLLTNSETLFGVQPMLEKAYLPDLAIFLNPTENLNAIRECTLRNIPSIGIIDSDTDPRLVTYPIPANMESLRTAELIVGTLSIAGQEGRRLRLKEAEEVGPQAPSIIPEPRERDERRRNWTARRDDRDEGH